MQSNPMISSNYRSRLRTDSILIKYQLGLGMQSRMILTKAMMECMSKATINGKKIKN